MTEPSSTIIKLTKSFNHTCDLSPSNQNAMKMLSILIENHQKKIKINNQSSTSCVSFCFSVYYSGPLSVDEELLNYLKLEMKNI
ncbi:CLUMA_CG021616, isoform A [Clunio marinus]|uniref:CLUMA_CG021616, isoform A n=1 Tax=Clunio marinus TaxID=568069 RepID=A0A1J1JB91_9DIPT|nr:CLUMA_CG021616, isoform A [Clunio marinus]